MFQLTEDNYKSFIVDEKVVLYFYSKNCVPCKIVRPTLNSISMLLKKVRFGAVDVEEEPAIAQEFSVRSLPTIIVMCNGEAMGQIVGSNVTRQKIVEILSKG